MLRSERLREVTGRHRGAEKGGLARCWGGHSGTWVFATPGELQPPSEPSNKVI